MASTAFLLLESLFLTGENDLFLRGAGGGAFLLWNAHTWLSHHFIAWGLLVLAGLEILACLVFAFGRLRRVPSIPMRGKHLDTLDARDLGFIAFNKLATTLFSYHLLRFLWLSKGPALVAWRVEEMTWQNTCLALPLLFVVYDFAYTLFHRALHHRALYKHIHKHHHRQKAPSRGNTDAVNVHPVEFVAGEYNHLAAIYLVSRFLLPVHALTALAFIVLGGFLASLNHTRFDIKTPGVLSPVYQVRYHDVHHWFPESNYGQYLMLWDHIFGSFKPYPEEKGAVSGGGGGGGKKE
ncbi:c-5 sterol desaturase [Nannochloropsis gaditana]|uniref:C-5 sterol desaturase n=1 Tax=Nannochloropsis gaditana TaxID=72520 RepID=W7T991_9STRA|nr:c-5 sterol desaturase [Nannochloropsis gaditana]